ncbi:hypothetical protein V4V35_24150 [Bacillus infantis]|uniref:hypothetical protein n=1 Tax=Bacillus infantis TaxID=324767 RepID=UPI002FBDDAFF
MKVKENFVVTELSLDGYKLRIPEGLSEMLNRSGAWQYQKTKPEPKVDSPSDNYDRKVVLEDGKLRSYLTYKKKEAS